MKRSAPQYRDATASSDPWRSLKFSAAFLAASAGPNVVDSDRHLRADEPVARPIGAQLDTSDNQGASFDSLVFSNERSVDARASANVPAEHREKYEKLLQSFEALQGLPIPASYTPGVENPADSVETNALACVRDIAAQYTTLLAIHRDSVGKDLPSFPFLGKMTTWIREGALVLPSKDTPPGAARYAIEQMWEYELSEAIALEGRKTTIPFVMNELHENRQAWSSRNSMGRVIPRLVDAESISSSWGFSQHTLFALGITSWAAAKLERGEVLSPEDQLVTQRALRSMLDQTIFDLSRVLRGERLGRDVSQIAVWARIFGLRVLEDAGRHPELIALLPEAVREEKSRQALNVSLRDDIHRSVSAFRQNNKMNTGITGSFFHTSMTFSALAAVSPDHRESLVPYYLEKVLKQGTSESVWPYDPTRGFHVVETPRSSAGRGLPVHYCRLLTDRSATNAEKAISGLEQFYTYSGSLQANVSREGTHAGPDRLAPYYWAPGLYYAGRLSAELSQAHDILGPQEFRRLAIITDKITTAGLASFVQRHRIITHPGEATFQQIGPTFSTALTMAALRDLESARRLLVVDSAAIAKGDSLSTGASPLEAE